MRISDPFKLIVSIVVAEAAGVIGAFFTEPSIAGWYAALVKPALVPPGYVFGPVWAGLFVLMGIALFFMWRKHSNILENVRMLWIWRWGIALFFIQLILNTLWSVIFFGFRNPGAAFAEIIVLWLAILATSILFYKISKPAAWLLVPYILWVSFAVYLNYAIWMLN
ncbi:TspO protein [Candidatus Kaiserbacteria bacterium RIFCSPHIGHO2_02_FULL_49_11]|uniref:TspO protein n=1 Tax=Candidatus Kaiserbacteria bacterium RIFCSPHIGHO2_02_FULL_49_11 TaxID=1798489 RepID=A0A1F6D1K6_9BACT|nr:MAG: TspO protein [Candidatus Kaiserbacteria bacterium RIFCSPHIGHO2_02_FULL_49_11]